MSTLLYVLVFALMSLPVHEFFHLWTLQLLGGDGVITFSWAQGYTHCLIPPCHNTVVDLAGGILTAALFLSIWVWTWRSKTLFDTNLETAMFTVAIGHLAYAPTELFSGWGLAAFGVGFAIAGLVYYSKVGRWIAG